MGELAEAAARGLFGYALVAIGMFLIFYGFNINDNRAYHYGRMMGAASLSAAAGAAFVAFGVKTWGDL